MAEKQFKNLLRGLKKTE